MAANLYWDHSGKDNFTSASALKTKNFLEFPKKYKFFFCYSKIERFIGGVGGGFFSLQLVQANIIKTGGIFMQLGKGRTKGARI